MGGKYSRWNAARARPAPPPKADPGKADAEIVARIGLVAQNGRTIWFGLLAYLAFVTLTLLSVRDIDFFSLESRTTLPIVNIAIPTTVFFWTAAWLGAAFHAFLHLYLLKLWDPLAEAPARVGGRLLGEAIHPWLVCDWALRRRPDRADAITPRPMAWLADLVALVMVWLAAPLVLAAFWLRSMPAHDEGLTLTIAAALLLSLYASRKGWRRATARLRDPGAPVAEATGRAAWPGRLGFAAVALLLAAVSWARTEGGFEHHANRLTDAWEGRFGPVFEDEFDANGDRIDAQEVQERRVAARILTLDDLSRRDGDGRIVWTPLAATDLVDADLAGRPADWLNRDTAERRFRVVWCRDRAIPPDACHAPREDDFGQADDAFAAARALHAHARAAWCDAEKRLDTAACPAHFAALDRAFAAEWREQRDGALANLAKPAMRGRDLRGAQAWRAFLTGLDLSFARMEGADLSEARMEGADLFRARMEGAVLSGARMEGAVLRWAQFQSAEWAGATIGPSPAHSADFTGGRNLTQSQLDLVIGNDDTILPPGLHVWSCWADPPPGLDAMLERAPRFLGESVDDLRARWLCSPDNPRRKVGRPAPE